MLLLGSRAHTYPTSRLRPCAVPRKPHAAGKPRGASRPRAPGSEGEEGGVGGRLGERRDPGPRTVPRAEGRGGDLTPNETNKEAARASSGIIVVRHHTEFDMAAQPRITNIGKVT